MGLFVVGNLLSASAPTFGVMLVGRVVAALAHGAFFGIGSVVAAGLVAPAKKADAVALMFTGLTVANIVGVPLGTASARPSAGGSRSWSSPRSACWPPRRRHAGARPAAPEGAHLREELAALPLPSRSGSRC